MLRGTSDTVLACGDCSQNRPETSTCGPSCGPNHGTVSTRPWLIANMIASFDGAATVDGRSGQLGGPPDQEVFHALRGLADVILVGAGTVRAERFGTPRHDPEDTERRLAAGMDERARIAMVTSSLELELDLPVFSDPDARPLVLAAPTADADRRRRLEEVADVVTAGEPGWAGRSDRGAGRPRRPDGAVRRGPHAAGRVARCRPRGRVVRHLGPARPRDEALGSLMVTRRRCGD